jgi:hypothetical protein
MFHRAKRTVPTMSSELYSYEYINTNWRLYVP